MQARKLFFIQLYLLYLFYFSLLRKYLFFRMEDIGKLSSQTTTGGFTIWQKCLPQVSHHQGAS
jgi:hypothetical protein